MSGGVSSGGLSSGTSASGPGGGSSGPDGGQGGLGSPVAAPVNGGIGRVGLAGTAGITKPEADVWYVNVEGDTMTGLLVTPSGPLQLSAATDNTLTWGAGGLYVPPPPERQTLEYRYSTSTTMADPGAGVMRANGATGPVITALAFDVLTDGGRDASILLRTLQAGDHIYVQDKDDSSHWTRFSVTAPNLDRSGWFEVPVAYISGSASSPGNNARVDVAFTLSPGAEAQAEVSITGDAGIGVVESPENVFALATRVSADANNTVTLHPDGLYVAAGAIPPEYVTDSELATALGPYATDADLAAHAAAADPHPVYLTQTEGDARYATAAQADVTVNVDGSLTATEAPANTFALAVRLSPDSGNALALRANGLYGTDTTGGAGAEVTITGTEGVTVVESPANTFALGLTASPDANNTIEIRANGIYAASGAIPPEYVTDSELTAALGPYATDADLAAHAAAADPHPGYLTQTEGDARYAPIGGGGTAEVTITGDNGIGVTESPANTFALATRVSGSAGNSLVLQAGGLFVPDFLTQAEGDALYGTTKDHSHSGAPGSGGTLAFVDEGGDTMTGALVLQGATATTNVLQGKLAADTQPRFRADASGLLEWGPGGASAPDTVLRRSSSATFQLTGALHPSAGGTYSLGTGTLRWFEVNAVRYEVPDDGGFLRVGATNPANAGAVRLRNAAAVAWRNAANSTNNTLEWGAADRFVLKWGTTEKVGVASTGTVTLTPDAGQPGLVATRIDAPAGQNLRFGAGTNYVSPVGDNTANLGEPAVARWASAYITNGVTTGSSAAVKEAITPLAPEDALAAVRATDPVLFDYKAPERTAEWYELPDDPEQAAQVLEQRMTAAPLEEGARHQAGFVLSSPDYATAPLFETGSGQSNAANTAGVLLAAVKALDTRLTALEGA